MSNHIGAVEAGGTKFRAAVLTTSDSATSGAGPAVSPQDIVSETRIDTTTPQQTMQAVIDFFGEQPAISALGIASFGPLIVDPDSATYGALADTPKPGWSGAPILQPLAAATGAPAEIQTDVEAAAVAEYQLGAGRGLASLAYVTVGTGIGVSVAIDGHPFRGRDHTEMGHIPVRRSPHDSFAGNCPFHGDCLEGMASGPAIEARWGARAEELSDNDQVWELEAFYLAQLVRTLAYSFVPETVLFSGGVGARDGMADLISAASIEQLGGYSVSHKNDPKLVARAELGNDAGLTGAALLAATLL